MRLDDQTRGSTGPSDAGQPPPPEAVARLLGTALEETSEREAVGVMIGPYRLVEKLGQGGCGTVWLAEQQEPIQRRVALKIVKAGLDTEEVMARFETERQALAVMDHPHIARVFDAGDTASGRPYFAMELVRGIAITRYADDHRLPLEARLQLFMSVCDAVQHAHQKGVIHRDLKPSNILVAANDGVPTPKVIDFGIAKAIDQRLAANAAVTQSDAFVGTPAYTSPEQLLLGAHDVDTRSDIYCLGAVLYELLAGRPPFDGKAWSSFGLEEMRRTIREIDPPRPSARFTKLSDADRIAVARERGTNAAKLTALLHGDLDWIVMRCLEKDRTRRYQTTGELADDLRRYLGNEPVHARPPSAVYRLRKLVRRNRLTSAVVIGGTLLVAAGTCIYIHGEYAASEATQRRAQIELIFSSALAVADPGSLRGRNATLKELLDYTAQWAPGAFADDPRLSAAIQAKMGETYCKLGLFEQAAPHLEAAWAARRSLPEEHPDFLMSLRDLGVLRVWQQRYAEAEMCLGRVLAVEERTLGRDAEETLKTRHELLFGRILRLTIFNLRMTVPDRAKLALESERLARESFDLARRRFGDEHTLTLLHEQNIAMMLSQKGRGAADPADRSRCYAEAERLLDRNYKTCTRVLGSEHPLTLSARVQWGRALIGINRNDEALPLLEASVPLFERVMGAEHFDTAYLLMALEWALRLAGREDEANRLRPRYLAIWLKTYGPSNVWNHGFVLDRLHQLAEWFKQPDLVAQFAQERLEELRDRDRLPPDNTGIATMRLALAVARHAQSRMAMAAGQEPAARALTKAGAEDLRAATTVLGRVEPFQRPLWVIHRDYGDLYRRQRRFEEAETELLLAEARLKDISLPPIEGVAPTDYIAAVRGLVLLYSDWEQLETEAHWRRTLEAIDAEAAEWLRANGNQNTASPKT